MAHTCFHQDHETDEHQDHETDEHQMPGNSNMEKKQRKLSDLAEECGLEGF